MARYRHRQTGVIAHVADNREMDPAWEPLTVSQSSQADPSAIGVPTQSASSPEPDLGPVEPPRVGKGSSRRAWMTYAIHAFGLDAAELEGWSRDDIVELVDAHQGG